MKKIILIACVATIVACKKGDVPQKEVIPAPRTVSLSVTTVPAMTADKITVEYGDSVIINANSSGNTITWNKSDVTYTSSAQFKLKGLTESTTVNVTAKDPLTGVTETKTMAVTVTIPFPEIVHIIGSWKIIELWGDDRVTFDAPPKWVKNVRDDRDNPVFYETIHTYHLDKTFTRYVPDDPIISSAYSLWGLKRSADGKLWFTDGKGNLWNQIHSVKANRLEILTEVNREQFGAGFTSNIVVFEKVK